MQISTYSGPGENTTALPRDKYTEICSEKVNNTEQARQPQFKTCKFTSEAIITEGNDRGSLRKVCANPRCPVHHPKANTNREDAERKAHIAKQKRELAIAEVTNARVVAAIGAAVPVRLLKRDLQFAIARLADQLGESRLEWLAKQHGIKRHKEADPIDKLFAAFLKRADEGTLSRLLIQSVLVFAASRGNGDSCSEGGRFRPRR